MNRRRFLAAMSAVPVAAAGAPAAAGPLAESVELRGSVDATQSGLIPGAAGDQSVILQTVLDRASRANKPVFLPPGNYLVSNISLPPRTRLMGVPGASRLVYAGGGHFVMSEDGAHVEITGLVFDGANRRIEDYAEAVLRVSGAQHLVIDNCRIMGSQAKGIHVERSSGRIERSSVSGAIGDCAIYGLENSEFAIVDNQVSDCANGGILVHRWQAGEDGTIVSGNRVRGIGAANGGTGQWGNGINVFRAHSVMIANNHVSDCAFSAIRANAGNNVQITGNQCLRSGETAIYSEFEFNGAMIANNIVDGGAKGICITNFMQGGRMAVCANNLVRNIHRQAPYRDEDHIFGLGIAVEADTTLTGNVVENTERFGLLLGWGPYLRDVVVTSNVIRKTATGVYVSVVEGAQNTVISDNVISETPLGSIVGYRWHDPVTKDMGGGRTFGYSHLTIERNRLG